MSIKELTKLVQESCKCTVRWELGKTYRAYDVETERLVAEYRQNGTLALYKEEVM